MTISDASVLDVVGERQVHQRGVTLTSGPRAFVVGTTATSSSPGTPLRPEQLADHAPERPADDAVQQEVRRELDRLRQVRDDDRDRFRPSGVLLPVSYTHLTLPTILRV